jgi:hypothetical protein
VHSPNPSLLNLNGYHKFNKLRPHDHPLGKKGGGILLFVREYLCPRPIPPPDFNEFEEILWMCIRPKVLPRPLNIIMVGLFYFAPNQNLQSKQKFIEKLNGSIDRIRIKYTYAGIFLLGDQNDLSLDSTCRNFNLKQMVDFPTTKGGTQLDVIYTNIKQYYKKPTLLPAVGGSYHYSIKIIPDFEAKHNYKVIEICSRPVIDKS